MRRAIGALPISWRRPQCLAKDTRQPIAVARPGPNGDEIRLQSRNATQALSYSAFVRRSGASCRPLGPHDPMGASSMETSPVPSIRSTDAVGITFLDPIAIEIGRASCRERV